MDKVRKPSNSVCYTPSSEPYRILETLISELLLLFYRHIENMDPVFYKLA
jgi:hypothetical protein